MSNMVVCVVFPPSRMFKRLDQ